MGVGGDEWGEEMRGGGDERGWVGGDERGVGGRR